MAARRVVTGRHNERGEKETGRREGRKTPGVVVVVVQGTPALNVPRREAVEPVRPCRNSTVHEPRVAGQARLLPAFPTACQTKRPAPIERTVVQFFGELAGLYSTVQYQYPHYS